MNNTTWVKSDEGNFIAVDKVTHLDIDENGKAFVCVGSGYLAGTFSSAAAFFEAMTRGLSQEEIGG